jgi:hypothetical protein
MMYVSAETEQRYRTYLDEEMELLEASEAARNRFARELYACEYFQSLPTADEKMAFIADWLVVRALLANGKLKVN